MRRRVRGSRIGTPTLPQGGLKHPHWVGVPDLGRSDCLAGRPLACSAQASPAPPEVRQNPDLHCRCRYQFGCSYSSPINIIRKRRRRKRVRSMPLTHGVSQSCWPPEIPPCALDPEPRRERAVRHPCTGRCWAIAMRKEGFYWLTREEAACLRQPIAPRSPARPAATHG